MGGGLFIFAVEQGEERGRLGRIGGFRERLQGCVEYMGGRRVAVVVGYQIRSHRVWSVRGVVMVDVSAKRGLVQITCAASLWSYYQDLFARRLNLGGIPAEFQPRPTNNRDDIQGSH